MAQLVVIVLVVLAALGIRRFLRNTPLARYSATTQSLIWLGLVLLLLLALTGRLGSLIPILATILAALVAMVTRLLPMLIPLIVQLLPRWRRHSPADRGGAGGGPRSSSVQSRYVRMRLEHATGDLDGEILAGPHAGRPLHELNLSELADLHRLYSLNDDESARLLAAYISRVHGDRWQDTRQNGAGEAGKKSLDQHEAYDILGLQPGAAREEIIAAHRRLIQKLHPDRGGSDYLAAKINQAKDLLLGD